MDITLDTGVSFVVGEVDDIMKQKVCEVKWKKPSMRE